MPTPVGLYFCPLLIAGGIGLLAASSATDSWIIVDFTFGVTVRLGLFEVCDDNSCLDYTHESITIHDNVLVIRGLCFAAIGLYVIAILIMAHLAFTHRTVTNKNHAFASLVVCVLAGACALAAVGRASWINLQEETFITVHGVVKYLDHVGLAPHKRYNGYSLHLAWVSAAVVLSAAIALFCTVNTLLRGRGPGSGQVIAPGHTMAMQVTTNSAQMQQTPGVMYGQPMAAYPPVAAGYPNSGQYPPPQYVQQPNPNQSQKFVL